MPLLKDRLVEDNLGLVRMAIKRYRGFGVEDEDLIQIGLFIVALIGLVYEICHHNDKK